MNRLAYREARVKVTEEVKEALIDLVKQEQDAVKKKKHPSKWYRKNYRHGSRLERKRSSGYS